MIIRSCDTYVVDLDSLIIHLSNNIINIHLIAKFFLGAVMTRTPSEERLEATSSLAEGGSVYFRENIRDTILVPSSALSSCFPPTTSTPSFTQTFSSSGRYWLVSRLTSILSSSSLTRMTSLSFLSLKMSMLEGKSVLREGSIHRRGNIHPFSHRDLESCRISDLASDWLTSFSFSWAASSAPLAEDSSMMLLDMHAMFLKSSSNFFHMSLDSLNMASRTLSKSSQVFLKKGSKKKSLMVTGTLDPDMLRLLLREVTPVLS